jgi:aryl-alcohol dehydrogenase-like predicted oxidoreductase
MGADPNERGASRRWITRSVEASLRRLGTAYIDRYQMHRPDPYTDVLETVEALDDLVRAGKVRYYRSSMFPAELLVEAQLRGQQAGRSGFHAEQTQYSIFNPAG